jgi:hypothetical protein
MTILSDGIAAKDIAQPSHVFSPAQTDQGGDPISR